MPKIIISPFCFIFSFIVCYSMPLSSLLPLVTAVTCHEAGHLIAALICRSPVECVRFSPMGVTIKRKVMPSSYFHDVLIYSFGPLFSLILGLIALFIGHDSLCIYSLSLLILNLLPVKTFDGGRILYSILCSSLPYKADIVQKIVSAVTLILLWLVSLFLLLVTNAGPSLLLLCFYLFFAIFI